MRVRRVSSAAGAVAGAAAPTSDRYHRILRTCPTGCKRREEQGTGHPWNKKFPVGPPVNTACMRLLQVVLKSAYLNTRSRIAKEGTWRRKWTGEAASLPALCVGLLTNAVCLRVPWCRGVIRSLKVHRWFAQHARLVLASSTRPPSKIVLASFINHLAVYGWRLA
jgi:hypothetical protein